MIHLLHGAAGAPGDWDSFIPLLGGFRASAIDLYAGEVLDIDQAAGGLSNGAQRGDVLVGYSMGGRLALHALVGPQSPWSRAVIISSDPGSGLDPERIESDARWAELAREDWSHFSRRWAAQDVFGGTPPPWERRYPGKRRIEAIARGFERWSVGRQRDLRAELARVDLPVLWIVGQEDRKFVQIAENLVPRLRSARLEVIAGAGHRVPWDRPGTVAGLIQSFLS